MQQINKRTEKTKNLKLKKSPFWSSRIAVLFVLMLASRPVFVCLFGRFGAFLWQMDGGRGPTGLQVEALSCGEVVGLWSVGLVCLKGADWQSGDPVCYGIPGLTGLGGTVEQNGDHVCVVWVPSLTGLRGTALQSENCAVLCRF
jgi:hypothetical protein